MAPEFLFTFTPMKIKEVSKNLDSTLGFFAYYFKQDLSEKISILIFFICFLRLKNAVFFSKSLFTTTYEEDYGLWRILSLKFEFLKGIDASAADRRTGSNKLWPDIPQCTQNE